MSIARHRNFAGVLSLLFTGTALSSVLAFVTQLFLARSLSAVEFGRLSVVLVAINFFTPVGSAGVNWLMLRVFGQEGWRAERWLKPAASLVGTATLLSAAGLTIYLTTSRMVTITNGFVLVSAVMVLLGQVAVELGSSSFQLEDRYKALTLWQAAPQVGRFVVVMLAALGSLLTEDDVIAGYGILGLLLTGIAVRSLLSLMQKAIRLREGGPVPPPRIRDVMLEASPFALMTAFYVLYFQGGLVVVERLAGSAAAAEYNASSLIFTAFALIPSVVYMKFLAPKICRWAEHDRKTFVAAFHIGVPAMAGVGAILAILLVCTATTLTPLLYGAKYADAATLMMVRAVAVPISFAQMTYSSLFISKTDMMRKVSYLGITAVVSITANLILVSAFGVIGAAVASVISELVLLLLHVLGTARHIGGIDVWATSQPRTWQASLRHLMRQDGSRSPAALQGE